jgi:hypothetical protein
VKKIYVVATFSGPSGQKQPSVVGHSPEEQLIDDVDGVLQAFLEGGMERIHLVLMKEKNAL